MQFKVQNRYQLKYYLMCGADGSIGNGQKIAEISAFSDEEAVEFANHFLQNTVRSGSVIPWGPILWDSQRLVAGSQPAYLSKTHHLAWRFAQDGSLVEVQPVSA